MESRCGCHDAEGDDIFFFNDTATTEIYTLSLHDALPISARNRSRRAVRAGAGDRGRQGARAPAVAAPLPGSGARGGGLERSEEHTSTPVTATSRMPSSA